MADEEGNPYHEYPLRFFLEDFGVILRLQAVGKYHTHSRHLKGIDWVPNLLHAACNNLAVAIRQKDRNLVRGVSLGCMD